MKDFISDALKGEHTYNLNVRYATQRDSQLTCGMAKIGDIIAITFINGGYMYSVNADYSQGGSVTVTRSELHTNKLDDSYTFKCALKK